MVQPDCWPDLTVENRHKLQQAAQAEGLSEGQLVWRLFTRVAERRQHDISSQERHLILGAIADGVVVIDDHERVTYCNSAAERTLGYSADEILGKSFHDTVHHRRADGAPYEKSACPIYQAFLRGETHRISDEVFWNKLGKCMPVDYVCAPVLDDGRVVGAVVVFRNITRQRRSLALLELQVQIARVLAESLPPAQTCPRVLAALGEALGFEAGSFWRVDDNLKSFGTYSPIHGLTAARSPEAKAWPGPSRRPICSQRGLWHPPDNGRYRNVAPTPASAAYRLVVTI